MGGRVHTVELSKGGVMASREYEWQCRLNKILGFTYNYHEGQREFYKRVKNSFYYDPSYKPNEPYYTWYKQWKKHRKKYKLDFKWSSYVLDVGNCAWCVCLQEYCGHVEDLED